MQSVMTVFPGAKMTRLTKKEQASAVVPNNESEQIAADAETEFSIGSEDD